MQYTWYVQTITPGHINSHKSPLMATGQYICALYLGFRAHQETRHVQVVHSHVLEDTAAAAHVLHRRRRRVSGRKLNLKQFDARATTRASEQQGGRWVMGARKEEEGRRG